MDNLDLFGFPEEEKKEKAKGVIQLRPGAAGYTADFASPLACPNTQEAKALGFINSSFIFTPLPYKNPNSAFYERKNYRFRTVYMSDPKVGLPFGKYPRIILPTLTAAVKRQKSRHIQLADSLADFVREMNRQAVGGQNGPLKLIENQVIRLFRMVMQMTSTSKDADDNWIENSANLTICDQTSLHFKPNGQGGYDFNWNKGEIYLSEKFYEDCMEHAAPIDIRVLTTLSSPVAIDIYTWLCYRTNFIKGQTRITWQQLKDQFGPEYADTPDHLRTFKSRFRKQLLEVLQQASRCGQNFNISLTESQVILMPGGAIKALG